MTPGRDNAFCLENCIEEGIFFVGGATDSNLKESDAKVLAITFDKNMTVLDELIIRDQSEKKMAVTSMRRDRKRNVLYCGVYQDIYIVEWTGSHFCILKCIDNIHSWLLTFIEAKDDIILSICKKDSYITHISLNKL